MSGSEGAGAEKSLRSFYAGVLGAHHQGKDGKGGSKHTKNSSFWNGLQAELEETMRHLFLKTEVVFFPPIEKPWKGPAGALLLGLTILSDWIASGDLFADAETWFDPEKLGQKRNRK
ncbi:MAG: HD domain-containing protein [Evtepia sp.]